MTIHVPLRFPARFTHDFASGIGCWTAGIPPAVVGGPREVVDGIFRSHDWGYDNNHLTTKGGPGMLHLMAYADFPYWEYQAQDGSYIGSDFTNALIKLRARGVNFNPNGSEFIVWITSRHPYIKHPDGQQKNVNWGFVAEPRTAQLTSGDWQDIEWTLSADPSKWVWGKGENGTIYDTFLSLQESLQNVFNIHFPTLGPDNVAHPTGQFELQTCEIIFNRNGAGLLGPMWDSATKSGAVSLSHGNLRASHAPFSTVGGVRGDTKLTGKRYWEAKHVSGDVTKCFAVGVCNASFMPGATFFGDTANGWGFLTERATRRHGSSSGWTETAWGRVIAANATLRLAFDQATGSLWVGDAIGWFGGGDPETGANPMFTGLTGEIYPCESSGTGQASFVFDANFSGPFQFAPPAGYSGPGV